MRIDSIQNNRTLENGIANGSRSSWFLFLKDGAVHTEHERRIETTQRATKLTATNDRTDKSPARRDIPTAFGHHKNRVWTKMSWVQIMCTTTCTSYIYKILRSSSGEHRPRNEKHSSLARLEWCWQNVNRSRRHRALNSSLNIARSIENISIGPTALVMQILHTRIVGSLHVATERLLATWNLH